MHRKIIDDDFEHSLAVYRDELTGGHRLHASVWEGALKGCPIWTAFRTLTVAVLLIWLLSLMVISPQCPVYRPRNPGYFAKRDTGYGSGISNPTFSARNTALRTSVGRATPLSSNSLMRRVGSELCYLLFFTNTLSARSCHSVYGRIRTSAAVRTHNRLSGAGGCWSKRTVIRTLASKHQLESLHCSLINLSSTF